MMENQLPSPAEADIETTGYVAPFAYLAGRSLLNNCRGGCSCSGGDDNPYQ